MQHRAEYRQQSYNFGYCGMEITHNITYPAPKTC